MKTNYVCENICGSFWIKPKSQQFHIQEELYLLLKINRSLVNLKTSPSGNRLLPLRMMLTDTCSKWMMISFSNNRIIHGIKLMSWEQTAMWWHLKRFSSKFCFHFLLFVFSDTECSYFRQPLHDWNISYCDTDCFYVIQPLHNEHFPCSVVQSVPILGNCYITNISYYVHWYRVFLF